MPVATEVEQGRCPTHDESKLVLVAIQHAGMRRFTLELVRREHRCRVAEPEPDELLAVSLSRLEPDLLVVDDRDFPKCCRDALDAFSPERVIVIGPEPDHGYRALAFLNGAGAWIPRERVGEDLAPAINDLLGCRHVSGQEGLREPDGMESSVNRAFAARSQEELRWFPVSSS